MGIENEKCGLTANARRDKESPSEARARFTAGVDRGESIPAYQS